MSSVFIDPWIHRRISPQDNCRNGQLVSAWHQSQMASLANQIARLRPKELATFHGATQGIGRNADWLFAAHTSPLCGAIVARLLVGKTASDSGDGTVTFGPPPTPEFDLYIANQAGTQLAYQAMFASGASGETINDVPDEWTVHTIVVDASAFRNTSIRGELYALFGGRLMGATIYEYPLPPDTIYGYINQQFSIGQSIKDSDRYDVIRMAIEQWKYGAAHLGNFSSYSFLTAPSVTTSTWQNVWDDSAAAARTPNSPCWMSDLRYCNTKRSTAVPCKLEAYVQTTVGTGTVRLVDETGTAVPGGFINVPAGTLGWVQTMAYLPATNARYYLEHGADGANPMFTFAASLYQFGVVP